jgi:hypothetical protein
LRLEVDGLRGPWTVRLTNEGDQPVRAVADVRDLSFDLTPRGAHQAVRCELPASMLPEDPLARAVVLAPRRVFVQSIDPRLYCFGAKAFAALAPGAIAVARLQPRGPAAVAPIDGVEPPVAPLRVVEAAPVALPDDPTPDLPPSWPRADASRRPALTLTGPERIDAASTQDIALPLTLRNEGSSPVIVRFRPDTLGFEVRRPGLTQQCAWPAPSPAPATRELYEAVPAHGSAQITIVLSAYCPNATFERRGLLAVKPWLDTRNASGKALGLRTFDDLVVATRPTLVRLQQTSTPEPATAPELGDEPAATP